MKINSELGYKPVTFSELTDDKEFWKGCQSCVNYDILLRTNFKHCLCTGMLYDPDKEEMTKETEIPQKKLKVYERWLKFKKFVFLNGSGKANEKKEKNKNFIKRVFTFFI